MLSGFIPHKERIVTIEDTQELRLHQEHVVCLESKLPNVEGSGEYTIRDLVRNALRMRPDRIVVGECRGGEALDMIQAMNTGHDGSMTTVHANSSAEVIERLEVLMLMAADLPMISIHRQIASAIDVIAHITRFPDGRRAVTQISEIRGLDPDTKDVIVTDIFNFRNGRSMRPTGYLPSFVDSLVEKGLLELEFLYGTGAAQQRGARENEPAANGKTPPVETPRAETSRVETPPAETSATAPENEGRDWYCRVMGQELGPMSDGDLRAIFKAGQVGGQDLIRNGASGEWTPAELTLIFQRFHQAHGDR